jgi:hypothetical protein
VTQARSTANASSRSDSGASRAGAAGRPPGPGLAAAASCWPGVSRTSCGAMASGCWESGGSPATRAWALAFTSGSGGVWAPAP